MKLATTYRPILATLVFSLFIGCGQQSSNSEFEDDLQGGTGAGGYDYGGSDIPGLGTGTPTGSPTDPNNLIGTQNPSVPSGAIPGSANPFASLSSATEVAGVPPLSQPQSYSFGNLLTNTESLIDRLYINPSNPNMFPDPAKYIPYFNLYFCSAYPQISGYPSASDDVANRAALTQALYLDILGRLPDTVSFIIRVNQLNPVSNPTTRENVARSIFRSAENSRRIVDLLYRTALGRALRSGEGQSWITQVQNGQIENAIAGIYASVEAFNGAKLGARNPSRWIAHVYRKFLGRAAYSWEINYWVYRRNERVLSNRVTTMKEIIQSFESEQKYVEAMFIQYLGRKATPTEIQHWLAVMQTNTLNRAQVAEKFLASEEYYVKSAIKRFYNTSVAANLRLINPDACQ